MRAQLADFLDWKNAPVGFDDAVKGVPPKLRGAVPKGFAHSVWELVEHVRIAQHDIRELLLVADHTAYHVAQIVDIRRALGIWKR